MIKRESGVTLLALVMIVVIILVITGMLVYSAKDNVYIKKLTGLNNDITILKDKVADYYSKKGKIPAETEYTNITNLINSGVIGENDKDGKYLILELKDLDGLTLNYGKDYEVYKNNKNTDLSQLTDLYIINDQSNNIFYVKGIQIREKGGDKTYYTTYTEGDKEEVKLSKVDWNFEDTEVQYSDGTIIVPKGFKVAEDSGTTINEGIVIEDVNKNQFVWVPVSKENFESEFIRKEGYSNNGLQQYLSDSGETDATGKNSQIEETVTTRREAIAMYKSVLKNGGFYIGRYESGKNSSGEVVIQKDIDIYNNIPFASTKEMLESETATTGGAVELSRNFYKVNNYTTVKSTLIYDVQWDAVTNWFKNVSNSSVTGTEKKYVENSVGMGWYSDNSGNTTHKTGTSVVGAKNQIKKIYDMAGNVWEWTMGSYKDNTRISRGGGAEDTGFKSPMSSRNSNTPGYTNEFLGFRIVLFLEN